MIIDANNITTDNLQADLCIVGAGIAGITISKEFINSNFDVLLLESGGLEVNSELQSLNSGRNIGLPYYNLDEARIRAFGGTSHKWHVKISDSKQGVRLRGLDKIDFEKREWLPNSGWPFDKEHIDPYYEKAHKLFKIGPYSYDISEWEDLLSKPGSYLETENLKTTIFQFARKDIFYNDYRNEIKKSKNVKTYLNATVLKVNLSDTRKSIEDLLVTNLNNKQFSVSAKYYILALGGLETPRLLLLSDDVMKCGIGNQNDLVGRYFMEHPHLWSGVFYPSNIDFFENSGLYQIHYCSGIPIMGKLTLSEEIMRREKLFNFTTSIHFTPMARLRDAVKSFKNISSTLKGGARHSLLGETKSLFKNFDAVVYATLRKILRGKKDDWYYTQNRFNGFDLNIMAEQMPDPESRVLLDTQKDKFGQRKIKLNWKLNPVDIQSMYKSLGILDSELRNSGLGKLEVDLNGDKPPAGIHGGWHHMGTTRMHNKSAKGVVDENCRVHGIENLYIAGSSVFPTGGYANPTLTIAALAIRLADFLKNQVIE